MITIKAELESKLFIILIIAILAVICGSIASIFIHFDDMFEDTKDDVSSYVSGDNNYSSNSNYYNSNSRYNSNSYNSNSRYNNSYNNYEDENATISDRIKDYINGVLNNDDK